jgi:polysaccharide biosynthesis protein VpsM
MKKTIRTVLITASLAAGSYAAPFMAIGDGAELFLTGSLGVRADDNIFLTRNNRESDLIFDITPGIDLTFGKNSQMKGSLTLSDMFSNYSDNSNLNTNLFSGDFVTRYDDGKMKLGFNLGYHELNQNTVDIRPSVGGRLVRRDIFSVGGDGEVEISQITAIGGGVSFRREDYKRRGYTDSDELTVPVNFYYKWTPKVDLSAGYRYRDYRVDVGQDSTDHFFNIGARGEFSPKFTGKFAIGLNTRKLDRGGDETQLGLDSSFAYEISPKTSLQFGASNDFGTSPQGQQQRNLVLNGMVVTKISEEWLVNAGLSWRSIDYDEVPAVTRVLGTTVTIITPRINSRTDDYFEGVLGTTYIVNANVRITGGYTYRNYSSDLGNAEFKNNVFSVAANFRY